jgi:uncharacterized coiled-coil protein SlyX
MPIKMEQQQVIIETQNQKIASQQKLITDLAKRLEILEQKNK